MIFIIFFIGTVMLGTAMLELFLTYRYNSDKTLPKIKFNSFLAFYEINEKRWVFPHDAENNKVACRTGEKYYYSDEEEFRFGFIDYFRYRIWIKRLNKKKEIERHSKKILKMMEAVKKDIASMEEISKNEIEKGKAILNEIKW